MSTVCQTSATFTSVRVAASPTVVNTTSNVVITADGYYSTATYTTCVPIVVNPIVKRQQNCTPSVGTTSTYIPGVAVTRQVPVQVTLTDFQRFSTILYGTSCSFSPLGVTPSPSTSSTSTSTSSAAPSASSPPSEASPSPLPASNHQQPTPTPSLASSVYVIPVPIATTGSSTLYSYSTSVSYFSTINTADGAQSTDSSGLLDSPGRGPPVNRLKVVGGVCGSIFGAVLLGFAGYFLFKKMTNPHKYKSGENEEQEHLRPEPRDQAQSSYNGSEAHFDQSQGASYSQGPTGQGQGSPFTHGANGSQAQGGSCTPETSVQGQGGSYGQSVGQYTQMQGPATHGVQGQGSYGQSVGQNVGHYTQMQGPETHGVQGQGTNYSNVQGQGTANVQQASGVLDYNQYGGHFPPGYDPFQAAQNAHQVINGVQPIGADGMQHYAHAGGDIQSQNPFLDTSGGLQGQMSQVPFSTPPSVQAGSGAGSAASLGLVLPAAAAATRRTLTPTVSIEALRSRKRQHPQVV